MPEKPEPKVSLVEIVFMSLLIGAFELLDWAVGGSSLLNLIAVPALQTYYFLRGLPWMAGLTANLVDSIPVINLLPVKLAGFLVTVYIANHPKLAKVAAIAQVAEGKVGGAKNAAKTTAQEAKTVAQATESAAQAERQVAEGARGATATTAEEAARAKKAGQSGIGEEQFGVEPLGEVREAENVKDYMEEVPEAQFKTEDAEEEATPPSKKEEEDKRGPEEKPEAPSGQEEPDDELGPHIVDLRDAGKDKDGESPEEESESGTDERIINETPSAPESIPSFQENPQATTRNIGAQNNQPPQTESALASLRRQETESLAAYLARADEIIRKAIIKERGRFHKIAGMSEEDMSQDVRQLIRTVTVEARKPMNGRVDPEANARALSAIKFESGMEEGTDAASFEKHTERRRKFFEIEQGRNSIKRETYWNTLFSGYDTKEMRELAKELLQNKKIALLGGGRAMLGEELRSQGIEPKKIINIDPFVENPEPSADPVVPESAASPELLAKLQNETFDEILATYSVPVYLDNPADIEQLFVNIDKMLAEGGTARIWPIGVKEGASEAARKSLRDSLQKLSQKGYEVVAQTPAAGRMGVTLIKPKHNIPSRQN